MDVWILTNNPSPYQIEFFTAVERSRRARVHVRFMRLVRRGAPWKPTADVEFEYRELRGLGPDRWDDTYRLHPGALAEVVRSRHDFYILGGQYASPTFVLCAVLLWLCRKRWAIWAERPWPSDYRPSWATSAAVRNPISRGLRRLLLGCMLRMATRVLCIGSMAMEAYHELGAARRKLSLLPYVCDVDRYAHVPEDRTDEARRTYGLQGKTVYLFSGQLTVRKGVDVLLTAFGLLARERPDVALLVLGDGPLREELQGSVGGAVADGVHFAGQVEQGRLPGLFRAADVFVFPSRYDGWAVVINEACAAGLPVITTDAVGASRDLVRDGHNGFVIARDDPRTLLEKMRYFADHPDAARRFGRRSREMVRKFSPRKGVELLLEAIAGGRGTATTPLLEENQP